MEASVRKMVRRRARQRCEYCHLPQSALTSTQFHIEHVIARQHGGDDTVENLALSCDRCNFHKGPNISSINSDDGTIIPLYNPRIDAWSDHFEFQGALIVGITPKWRATVRLLQMNARRRVALRAALIARGQAFR
jgi:hypothetical protein